MTPAHRHPAPSFTLLPRVYPALWITLTLGGPGCYQEPGACPDPEDRMDTAVIGLEGVAYGEECDALCPDGTALGSVEGTVALLFDSFTSDINADSPAYPHCAYAADLDAWRSEKCPGCTYVNYDRFDFHQPYPESCTHPYEYLVVRCDPNK